MPTLAGHVQRVKDGDTAVVRFENGAVETVRLWGIDAPESGQPYGPHGKAALQELAGGAPVAVDVETRGPYGRLIARVQTEEYDVGRSLVHSGYAWADRKNDASARLKHLEQRARQDGKGLWSQVRPVPPWRWRKTAPERKRRALAHGLLWAVGTLVGIVLFFAVLVAVAAT